MKKNTLLKKQGFSLIETLIAVSILMIAIVGPLSLVQAGLFSSIHQRNQVTATYLAQEAVEYIKNLRDTSFYENYGDYTKWLDRPSDQSLITICAGTGCYVDPHGGLKLTSSSNDVFVQSISSTGFLPLMQATSTDGVFTYGYGTNGTPSIYERVVKLEPIGGGMDEVKVSVTINWKDNNMPRSYTVRENIYNYQQQHEQ